MDFMPASSEVTILLGEINEGGPKWSTGGGCGQLANCFRFTAKKAQGIQGFESGQCQASAQHRPIRGGNLEVRKCEESEHHLVLSLA